MTAIPKKIAKPLGFEITAPTGMGLTKGEAMLGAFEDNLSPWLRFTIRPSKIPIRQQIWLTPKDGKRDDTKPIRLNSKTSRQLTSDIDGSLSFVTRRLAIIEEVSDVSTPTIGTLAYAPTLEDAEYGHAEFYNIEINLSEKDFNYIKDIFLSGKPPSAITVLTPDIEYGFAPDGSDKIWEVWETGSTFASIMGFSLVFSVDIPRVSIGLKRTENEEENENEKTEKKAAVLHSREDIQLLCYQQAALNASLGGLRKQISILIFVVIVIAIITMFHFKY